MSKCSEKPSPRTPPPLSTFQTSSISSSVLTLQRQPPRHVDPRCTTACHPGESPLPPRWESIATQVRVHCHPRESPLSLRWESIVTQVRVYCHSGESLLLLRWEFIVTQVRVHCHSDESPLSPKWESIAIQVRVHCHSSDNKLSIVTQVRDYCHPGESSLSPRSESIATHVRVHCFSYEIPLLLWLEPTTNQVRGHCHLSESPLSPRWVNCVNHRNRIHKAVNLHRHTMFFGGTGVRWRQWDVIGRMCHRSSMNKTFLHSTKESRNLKWQSKRTS